MSKKHMLYGIILAILILLAYLLYAFMHKEKAMNQTNVASTVGHFFGEGYSFDYPIFQNWYANISGQKIEYMQHNENKPIVIQIEEQLMNIIPQVNKSNLHFVGYFDNRTATNIEITFLVRTEGIKITFPNIENRDGFSSEKVRQTILDSFQIENNTQNINLQNLIGKTVTLEGTARDAKAGAILLINDRVAIYVERLDAWDRPTLYQKIMVTGKLVRKQYVGKSETNENGLTSQGGDGSDQFVLEDAQWKIKN